MVILLFKRVLVLLKVYHYWVKRYLRVKASTAGVTPPPIGTEDSNIPPTPQEEENSIIHYFRIYKIDPPNKINDNFRQLKFHFVSDIMFTNMQIKVQKTYPLKKNVNELQKTTNHIQLQTWHVKYMWIVS